MEIQFNKLCLEVFVEGSYIHKTTVKGSNKFLSNLQSQELCFQGHCLKKLSVLPFHNFGDTNLRYFERLSEQLGIF